MERSESNDRADGLRRIFGVCWPCDEGMSLVCQGQCVTWKQINKENSASEKRQEGTTQSNKSRTKQQQRQQS